MVWVTASPERTGSPDLLPLRTSLGTAARKKAGLVPPRTAGGASARRLQPVATSLALAGLTSQSPAIDWARPGSRGDAGSLLRNRWLPRGCPANSAGKGVGGPCGAGAQALEGG